MTAESTTQMISMTLRFYDPVIAKLFEEYCTRNKPVTQTRTFEDSAYVYHNFFNTGTEKSKFISGWAALSVNR